MSQLIKKSTQVLKNEGIQGLRKHAKHYIKKKQERKIKTDTTKDTLFINGCPKDLLPHPPRYRVTHQKEQLEINHYTTDEVYYENIDLNQIKMYNNFIIFRAPITPKLQEFINQCKKWNKTIFYDIDDLVIDTIYTNNIPYVQTMPKDQKQQYDKDILNNQKLLTQCDCIITTTKTLQQELLKYNKNVVINRNTASIEMVQLSQNIQNTKHPLSIGYFSGSITHNADFEMILPVIKDILETYNDIELHLTGEIDIPIELEPYKNQIQFHPFIDYKKLPQLISQMDINLAPLEKSIFNEAKSEIKWIEASLVKVVTIASNIGAFKEMIQHNQTGLLCDTLDDWKNNLIKCIESKEFREQIANNAYTYCLKNCTTMYTGNNLVKIIENYTNKNIMFGFTKLEISGGIMVALRHASILQDNGYDVSLLSYYDTFDQYTFLDHTFPVLPLDKTKHNQQIDIAVATMWPTVKMINELQNIKTKKYLVQNFETDFYDFKDPLKIEANQSYRYPFETITISKWCQEWLEKDFNQPTKYAYNGIDTQQFTPIQRKMNGKIKIMIEGDCSAAHKNVDESFKIVEKLDPDQYEVYYMSYNAKPKDWYRVTKFFNRIPYEEVVKVYQECDILLKTSLLESFSYPPLEMMATGGYVIAILNDGNKEYLKHKENCMIYEQGNINQAIEYIHEIINNKELQKTLYTNGIQTAKERDWKAIEKQILDLYD